MTLTDAQAIRLKIQDIPAIADTTLAGDGTAVTFALPHRNLSSASAFVPLGGTAWSATGATFNASGFVEFSGVISANSAWRARYVHSVFSDAEIQHFLDTGGSVNGGALEAVQTLMFDGLRRARWSAPDGTSHDDTAAIALLRSLYDTLKAEQYEAAIGGGANESWSLLQEEY